MHNLPKSISVGLIPSPPQKKFIDYIAVFPLRIDVPTSWVMKSGIPQQSTLEPVSRTDMAALY